MRNVIHGFTSQASECFGLNNEDFPSFEDGGGDVIRRQRAIRRRIHSVFEDLLIVKVHQAPLPPKFNFATFYRTNAPQ